MPMPKPKADESEDDFIDRCMSDQVMKDEYDDTDQRLAVCHSLWDKKEGSMKRSATPKHKTGTSDAAWDGPANETRLKTDQDKAYYNRAYAWRDPDGDESKKASYRFIHHEISEDGMPGAANIRGCQTGIGVLNGARGGTTIPADDRQGVWGHLAAHLRDADVEPAPLRSGSDPVERRAFSVELRIEDGETPKITGHAAVFDQLSVSIFGFREKIAAGAFAKTLKRADIKSLWNHNSDFVLGRNKSGTLRLEEDKKGLAIEIDPPDTQWARDLMTTIGRGDVDQMSFAFVAKKESWEHFEDGKESIRTLLEVELFDVSPVTYPAYPQTDVQVRSIFAEAGLDFDALADMLARKHAGAPLTEADQAMVRSAVGVLDSCFPEETEEPGGESAQGDGHVERLAMRQKLEIAVKEQEAL